MANLYFTHSSAPLKTVQEIQFGILPPDEIKNMSVCHILYPETMDEMRLKPREGGLNDPLLGSIDRQFKCKTCGQSMGECPGHFGHIELAKPVYHPGFIKKVKKVLEIVCHNCSKVKADRSDPDFVRAVGTREPKARFHRVWEICKKKRICDNSDHEASAADDTFLPAGKTKAPINHGGCGNYAPEVRHQGLTISAKAENNNEEGGGPRKKDLVPITAEQAMNIMRRISDEDLRDMGLNIDYARPEWMVVTVLPVPPPPVRPSVSMDGTGTGMRNEDDLTYKLGDIIRANSNVKQAMREGSPMHIQRDFTELLQYHVATYMDNDIAGQPRALQKSGRPVKAIRGRLKGKEGRLRGNLMGKRVDFSARTVITGDANLSLDEVGVPRSIARTLTYPETVTPYNISKLHELVENGPNEHPGAKYVIRSDGTRIDLRHHKRAGQISLEYGWKVERHLMTGDYIVFNRQPSLHKESMMGHRVRVMPYSTFRLNLSVTSPYNADFDGDEMNLHVPQSEETRAEIKELCMVPLNIVSPQRNGPLMGIVQDSLAGVYKMCRRDTFLNKEQIMNCLLWVPGWDGIIPQPAIFKPRPRWTGKQLISMIIPSAISLWTKPDNGQHNPLADDGVLVQSGELLYGLLTKKTVGASSGGIVHLAYNELGPGGAMAFLVGVQQVVSYWLLQNGHSIGIGDTIPDKVTIEKVQKHINEAKDQVEDLTNQATSNKLEALPGMNVRETFENKVSMALNKARDDAGKTTQASLKDLNNAVTMSASGSKGSTINISQMTALVGQQIVEGKRIPFGFKYRTLPHFTKDDYSPEARGFVENSYLRGLTPSEFFFHAMAGREGLIDTAVKTAETGYIQRRLVKALEDVSAKYDGTVRNSLGDIVQFLYGEDGLDGIHIEKQRMDHVNVGHTAFDKLFRVNVMSNDATENAKIVESLEYGRELLGDPEVQNLLDEEIEALKNDRTLVRSVNVKGEDSLQLPLNVVRIIDMAASQFHITASNRSDLRPEDVVPAVRDMLNRMSIVRGGDPISQEADRNATILFKAQLRSRLSFKRVAMDKRLNKLAFAHILGDLQTRWDKAFINPGEMVGVLAAQSIGEPATQMTLNTFHFAGVSSKNVTLGVPRLKEILNLATNIKTPSMQVFLDSSNASQEQAKNLRSIVEYTNLRSVTAMTEIYYDPVVTSTTIPADMDMIESFFLIPDDSDHSTGRQSRWLLRITLDRQKMLDKGLKIEDVGNRIKSEYPNDLAVVFSDNNAEDQVIRIRSIKDEADKDEDDGSAIEDDVMLKRLEAHLLDSLTLRGVPGIEKAFLTKGTILVEDNKGALIASKSDPICAEWYLDTSGSALREVLVVDGIDTQRTYTNSIWQVFEVFGIEAARSALCRELTNVLAFDGSYVNHRHIALLVDVMTYRGTIAAVTRHGINRADTGALMRCSFEETVEILLDAASSGELDDCRGISENVMLGQLAPMGTGAFEVQLDLKMLQTVISDNNRMGVMAGMPTSNDSLDGAATPYDSGSPMRDSGYTNWIVLPYLAHVVDGWSLQYFAFVQPFIAFVLPNIAYDAAHEPFQSQLQSDIAQLFPDISCRTPLLSDIAAVQLAHLS
ncbi:DNA-directed RNA polymerase II subunit rpb1 [Ceratocystis platani]|uniref:DNA-directed RNA polymerase subunit n=1 Tax=Ceratocystis fimbriata f. sp. platani TaxID=88771 RepID=A0A0F8D3B4_CERFI|nr:DNA-directed RNA polymerase II subunit rpb1 [Ceratocystis platani]